MALPPSSIRWRAALKENLLSTLLLNPPNNRKNPKFPEKDDARIALKFLEYTREINNKYGILKGAKKRINEYLIKPFYSARQKKMVEAAKNFTFLDAVDEFKDINKTRLDYWLREKEKAKKSKSPKKAEKPKSQKKGKKSKSKKMTKSSALVSPKKLKELEITVEKLIPEVAKDTRKKVIKKQVESAVEPASWAIPKEAQLNPRKNKMKKRFRKNPDMSWLVSIGSGAGISYAASYFLYPQIVAPTLLQVVGKFVNEDKPKMALHSYFLGKTAGNVAFAASPAVSLLLISKLARWARSKKSQQAQKQKSKYFATKPFMGGSLAIAGLKLVSGLVEWWNAYQASQKSGPVLVLAQAIAKDAPKQLITASQSVTPAQTKDYLTEGRRIATLPRPQMRDYLTEQKRFRSRLQMRDYLTDQSRVNINGAKNTVAGYVMPF